MTRERIAGFMLGIGVGTVIGFFLTPPDKDRRDTGPAESSMNGRKRVPPASSAPAEDAPSTVLSEQEATLAGM